MRQLPSKCNGYDMHNAMFKLNYNNYKDIKVEGYATIGCCKTVFTTLQWHFSSHNNVI